MTVIRKGKAFATERLYLNAAQDKIVKEGDPQAALLLAAKDNEIPERFVEKFGLLKEEPAPRPGPSAEAIETRQTRVPTVSKKRG